MRAGIFGADFWREFLGVFVLFTAFTKDFWRLGIFGVFGVFGGLGHLRVELRCCNFDYFGCSGGLVWHWVWHWVWFGLFDQCLSIQRLNVIT